MIAMIHKLIWNLKGGKFYQIASLYMRGEVTGQKADYLLRYKTIPARWLTCFFTGHSIDSKARITITATGVYNRVCGRCGDPVGEVVTTG